MKNIDDMLQKHAELENFLDAHARLYAMHVDVFDDELDQLTENFCVRVHEKMQILNAQIRYIDENAIDPLY